MAHMVFWSLAIFAVTLRLCWSLPVPNADNDGNRNQCTSLSCANGGSLMDNGNCVCPPTFTGLCCENQALNVGQPVGNGSRNNCLNGGYWDRNRTCECPPGTYGIRCEGSAVAVIIHGK